MEKRFETVPVEIGFLCDLPSLSLLHQGPTDVGVRLLG
jgi:hypothetical protein